MTSTLIVLAGSNPEVSGLQEFIVLIAAFESQNGELLLNPF